MQVNEIVNLIVTKKNIFLLPLLMDPELYQSLPPPYGYVPGNRYSH